LDFRRSYEVIPHSNVNVKYILISGHPHELKKSRKNEKKRSVTGNSFLKQVVIYFLWKFFYLFPFL